jgi:YfiH family protein
MRATPTSNEEWIIPEWPAPEGVYALATTRRGGFGVGAFSSFNLGAHVGDDPETVERNRARLIEKIDVRPVWLTQVHGARVVDIGEMERGTQSSTGGARIEADGALVREPGLACAVMTADCLPVLFCDDAASVVCAAHAGWRGLDAGILEAAVREMGVPGNKLLAWLGPAIGPRAFEVGKDVYDAFVMKEPRAAAAFAASENEGKWRADLCHLARLRLETLGVTRIYGGGFCTFEDAECFYSYRRDGETGRMASLIWISGGGGRIRNP